MSDADTVLRLVQNDVRRRILARLVREPHYPMQLAELLEVSQPAINKHLKELEAGGLVTKEQVPSEKGGPPRRVQRHGSRFRSHRPRPRPLQRRAEGPAQRRSDAAQPQPA